MSNTEVIVTDIEYGEECEDNNDCESKVCEMTYDKENNNPIGRKCILPNQPLGAKCITANDCSSGECKDIFNNNDIYMGSRCKPDTFKYDPPDEDPIFSDADTRIQGEYSVINPDQLKQAMKTHNLGAVGKFMVQLTSTLVDIVKQIIKILKNIFMDMFNLVWVIVLGPNYKTSQGPFGGLFFGLIHNKSKRNNGKCLQMYWFRTIVTILLPPFGVFMARGVMGLPYILLCSLLTAFLYFPGLIYAFLVINNSVCNNVSN
jgi:uncharacterized membrane protein YqaE (UPF0057 family)